MTDLTSEEAVAALFAGSNKPTFATTGERVADVLRNLLIEGRLEPGSHLPEEAFAHGLNVSRNTLREALRLLAHEGLVVHELNRGIFVRKLTAEDIISIYQVREFIEVAAVRSASTHSPAGISRARLAVTQALEAAEAGDWNGVGTANMRFHNALVALAGNERINAMTRQTLAELRLAFHVMQPLKPFHEPYLPVNQTICRLLEDGRTDEAADHLTSYLHTARDQLVDAYRAPAGDEP
ncbi:MULTISPECIES: GntR family transcriptional regulator [unclassified Aeromicrobium]|uniref:GntR family transcriptional regulator n=1 Tax=unclassified Aeromicrobium TaxID=2633570 RepID=UPI00396B3A20